MMRKKLAVLFIVAMLCPALAFGQRGRFGGRERRGGGGRAGFVAPQIDEQSTIVILTAILSLTDAQQAQLRANFDDAAKTAAPIAAQLKTTKDALFTAAKSADASDQIQKLAAQEGSLTTQMATLQAQTFAKMWALLTDDQKAGVDSTIYDEIGQFLSVVNPPAPATPTLQPPGEGRR